MHYSQCFSISKNVSIFAHKNCSTIIMFSCTCDFANCGEKYIWFVILLYTHFWAIQNWIENATLPLCEYVDSTSRGACDLAEIPKSQSTYTHPLHILIQVLVFQRFDALTPSNHSFSVQQYCCPVDIKHRFKISEQLTTYICSHWCMYASTLYVSSEQRYLWTSPDPNFRTIRRLLRVMNYSVFCDIYAVKSLWNQFFLKKQQNYKIKNDNLPTHWETCTMFSIAVITPVYSKKRNDTARRKQKNTVPTKKSNHVAICVERQKHMLTFEI